MVTKKENRTVSKCIDTNGNLILMTDKLVTHDSKPQKLVTYAQATLLPGEEVGFHIHEGESESYYFLSGKGMYNDNGTIVEVNPGDITFTASGEGHGLKNTGSENIEFMTLIILD